LLQAVSGSDIHPIVDHLQRRGLIAANGPDRTRNRGRCIVTGLSRRQEPNISTVV
jgi:hypothetical protein